MLLEISIKNFAIIEEISLNFEQGMTVLTGETGAGKSIIIDAMNMMLGSRATTDVIRHGASKAEIEGLFAIEQSKALVEIFEQQGLDMTEELIIRREIFQNGRSVSRINGQMDSIWWIFTVSTTKKNSCDRSCILPCWTSLEMTHFSSSKLIINRFLISIVSCASRS